MGRRDVISDAAIAIGYAIAGSDEALTAEQLARIALESVGYEEGPTDITQMMDVMVAELTETTLTPSLRAKLSIEDCRELAYVCARAWSSRYTPEPK